MKTVKQILVVIALLISSLCVAQTTKSNTNVVLQGSTYVNKPSVGVGNDEKTTFTYKDKVGKVYPVYKSKTGKLYCIRISRNGNEYKYYLKP